MKQKILADFEVDEERFVIFGNFKIVSEKPVFYSFVIKKIVNKRFEESDLLINPSKGIDVMQKILTDASLIIYLDKKLKKNLKGEKNEKNYC